MSTPARAPARERVDLPSVPRHARLCASAQEAFTLVELLVAISVSVVLAGLLVVVTRGALDLWQRAQDRSTASVQAKTALNLLVSDFQSLLYRASGEPTIALNLPSAASLGAHNWRTSDPLLKPDSVALFTDGPDSLGGSYQERSRFGRSGAWLRITAFNHGPEGTRPQAISYQIVRRPVAGPINANPSPPIRYILFRSVTTPELTFSKGYSITAYDSDLGRPALDQALCDNVVDFGLWFYRRESSGTLMPLYPTEFGARDFRAQGGSGAGAFPDVVDIMLRVISESGAARLEQMELGRVARPPEYASDEEWWWAVVEAESRIYAERVSLNRPRGL